MCISIHFFRNRGLERIDYEKLIDYFDQMGTCEIIYNDDNVEIVNHDPIFDFPYRFLITKRSQVKSIYSLNVDFYNINLLVEIPVLLPSPITKTILTTVMELCKAFELQVYYSGVQNIEPFDMIELLVFLEKERAYYIDEHADVEFFYVEREKLLQVCNYQQMMPYLPSKIKDEAVINPYIVMLNNDTKDIVFSIKWEVGTAMVFPPNLDYIHVVEEGVISIVPAATFFKYCGKLMYELRDYMPNVVLSLLCGRAVNKAKKLMRKVRKESIPHTLFTDKKIINLIEK